MTRKTFSKPDFIAIGPPKTGTTWIYRNLDLHPEVWMPPDKEIRHFWERALTGNVAEQVFAGNIESQTAFVLLDCLTFNNHDQMETSIYRKPTFSATPNLKANLINLDMFQLLRLIFHLLLNSGEFCWSHSKKN